MSSFFFQRASLAGRGRCNFKHIAIAACAVVLLVSAVTNPARAGQIRVDGDYMYLTEDFESVEGDTADLGFVAAWGNGVAIDASDLWHCFSHDIGQGYGTIYEDPTRFPYLSSSHPDLQFVLIDSEMPPGYPGERNDGWGLILRSGYQDVITFPADMEILEFSCDVFLPDTFPIHTDKDSHAIDFIGTEGYLRHFLRFDELTQHVTIANTMFAGAIGELQAVRLESSCVVFDNLTVKTWAVPEPGLATFLAGGLGLCALRRKRTENIGRTYSGLRA